MPTVVIELIYPSGHRQEWHQVKLDAPRTSLYECVTYCPDGRSLEFRIMSSKQLERTLKRVHALGGRVRIEQGEQEPECPDETEFE